MIFDFFNFWIYLILEANSLNTIQQSQRDKNMQGLPERGFPLMLQVTAGLGMPSAVHSSFTVSPGAYNWLFGSLIQYGAARENKHNMHNITQ